MSLLKPILWTLAVVAFFLFSISFAWTVYHSSRGLTTSDVEPVQKAMRRVEASLKQENGSSGNLGKLKEEQEKLLTDLRIVRTTADPNDPIRRAAASDLDNIALNLAVIQNRLMNNRDENYTSISEALTKLDALHKQVEPTATPERIVGLAMVHAAKLLVELAWPLLFLLLVILLLKSRSAPERLAEILGNFKSVELFGTKLEIGEKIKTTAETKFESLRKKTKHSFDYWVQKKSLEDKVRALLSDPDGIINKINEIRAREKPDGGPLKDYRCTIHVPDLVFAETFYQLIDYIPRQPGPETRGRIWSFRFGFIGRLWRSEQPHDLWGQVPTSSEELISQWGMTKEEAENAGKDRQSFLGVLLKQNRVSVGLLYLDAKEPDAFGKDEDKSLRKFIAAKCESLEITKDLLTIKEELSGRTSLIRIYSQR